MGTALFICFIFMHIAFSLGLAFFILFSTVKTEHKFLKYFGFFVSAFLIILALLSMIFSTIFAVKKPDLMRYPHHHKEFMEHQMPMMQNDEDEDVNDKSMLKKKEEHIITGKACPIKSKEEIEKEIMQGVKTGAACRVD